MTAYTAAGRCWSGSSGSPSSSSRSATPRWALAARRRGDRPRPLPGDGALHTGLLVGCLVEVWLADRPFLPALGWPMLALVLAAQALRWWCIRTLGPHWNTRVIVVPGLPLVTAGPYRWLRHPNYVAVVVEGIALPLVHTAWLTALVFTVLNAALLAVRIRVRERRALAEAAPSRRQRGARRRWSPAAARSGSPPRSRPALAGMSVAVVEPRAGAGGQGLRRGTDAGRRWRRCAGSGCGSTAGRCAASATSTPRAARGAVPRRRRASACAAPRCSRAAPRGPRSWGCSGCTGAVDRTSQQDDGRVDAAGGLRARYLVGRGRPALAAAPGSAAALDRARAGRPRGTGCAGTTGSRPGPTSSRCTGRPTPRRTSRRSARDLVGVAVLAAAARRFDDLAGTVPGAGASGSAGAGRPVRGAGPLRQRRAPGGCAAGCCWSATPPATSTR